ncbi:MAG: hypothetical protein IJZ92_06000 [Bacteroidaceae bacterium]|nr:hypothetical protein [Bacteroidaceae bacterium]
MKKNKTFVAAVLAGCALMFSAPAFAQTQTVSMQTSKEVGSEVTLLLNKTTGISVDWGDGTFVPVNVGSEPIVQVAGEVKGATIKVQGDRYFTMLGCAGNGLVSIDATDAPFLQSLYCQNNELTTLNITGLTELTDLNCANNQLTLLPLDEVAYPNLQNIDVSNNQLSGRFAVRSESMRYLNINNNEYNKLYVQNNSNLLVLQFASNVVSGTFSPSGYLPSVETMICNDNQLSKISVSASVGMPNLKTIICDNNSLAALDLSLSQDVEYISCANNALTEVSLHAKATPASYVCGGNALTFASLPTRKPAHFVGMPQAKVDITSLLQKADLGYYYVTISPDYSSRNDYAVDLSPYRVDGGGMAIVTQTPVIVDADGNETNMAKGTSASTKDYTVTNGVFTFYKPYEHAYVKLTHRSYPDMVLETTHFSVRDLSPEGIDGVVEDGNLAVTVVGGALVFNSSANQAVNVYAADGKNVWSATLAAGETTTVSLPKGVYIVNGKKVII